MELVDHVFEILGRSRGARLIVLGLFLITSGGVGLTVADSLKINSAVPGLFVILGVLAFRYGLDVYSAETKNLDVETAKASKERRKSGGSKQTSPE